MRKFNKVFVALCCITSLNSFSQGEIDTEKKIFFRDESTFALLLNSNGYGINYRYARRQNAFRSTLFDFDVVRIKSPKEKKVQNEEIPSSPSFVYGQVNSLASIRAGIGLQRELYEKEDKGSVSIRLIYTTGLSLGLVKPFYYIDRGEYARFDINLHAISNSLDGKAPFYKGFNEIRPVPGGFLKVGFTFEYSNNDKIINAFEGAIAADAFLWPIEIIATHKSMFYVSFILSYRFGKAIDKKAIRSNRRIDNLVNVN
jgi:hypothetical protein